MHLIVFFLSFVSAIPRTGKYSEMSMVIIPEMELVTVLIKRLFSPDMINRRRSMTSDSKRLRYIW